MIIRTVLGDIRAESAGHIQCHEHILLCKGRSYEINPTLWMDDLEASGRELAAFRAAGGGLIADAQPVFAGRMAKELMRLSKRTGVHIVATTGFHKRQFYYDDERMMDANEEEITRTFLAELTVGMLGDDEERLEGRCGLLKGALEADGLDASVWYRRRFQALANTANQAGAPLSFHVDAGARPEKLLLFLLDCGIDLDRVMLCHLDRTHRDPALHRELLQAGVRLNYDSVCRLNYVSHRQELDLIAAMCGEGFASRITLSLDTTRDRLSAYGGEIGLSYLLTTFIPMLRQRGIKREEILMLTRTNGQAALQFRTEF